LALDALNVEGLFRRGQVMVGLRRFSDAQKGESLVPLVRLFFFSDDLVDFEEVLKLDPKIRPSTELTKKEELKLRVVRYWLSATSSAIDQTRFEDYCTKVLGTRSSPATSRMTTGRTKGLL
jgi:hypothetical protein